MAPEWGHPHRAVFVYNGWAREAPEFAGRGPQGRDFASFALHSLVDEAGRDAMEFPNRLQANELPKYITFPVQVRSPRLPCRPHGLQAS